MWKMRSAGSSGDVINSGLNLDKLATTQFLLNLKILGFAGSVVILLANTILEGAMLAGYASPPPSRALATQQMGVVAMSLCALAAVFMTYFLLDSWNARGEIRKSRERLEAGLSGR